MLVTAAFVLGFIIGWLRAKKMGGNRMDSIQYALVHALALTMAVLIGWVIVGWLNWV
jgi:hypothetical protein